MWITRGLGLRAVALDERLQVDAVEVFHRVIEDAFGRAAVVVDRDGVRVVELAGDLHFALEALDRRLVDFVDVEHLDGRRAAEHGVMALVDDAHAAGAELASSWYWPSCLASIAAFWASRRERASMSVKTKMAAALRASRAEQAPERPAQDRERAEGFGVVDFRNDADVAARAAISRRRRRRRRDSRGSRRRSTPDAAGDGFGGGMRERQLGAAQRWAIAAR